MSRKKSRELLFKLVFENCFHENTENITFSKLLLEDDFEVDSDFVQVNFEGILKNKAKILEEITNNLEKYKLERLFKVDLSILIVAIYELKFSPDKIDNGIIINEAVELAKKYSTEKSYSFINGILAKVIK